MVASEVGDIEGDRRKESVLFGCVECFEGVKDMY